MMGDKTEFFCISLSSNYQSSENLSKDFNRLGCLVINYLHSASVHSQVQYH